MSLGCSWSAQRVLESPPAARQPGTQARWHPQPSGQGLWIRLLQNPFGMLFITLILSFHKVILLILLKLTLGNGSVTPQELFPVSALLHFCIIYPRSPEVLENNHYWFRDYFRLSLIYLWVIIISWVLADSWVQLLLQVFKLFISYSASCHHLYS